MKSTALAVLLAAALLAEEPKKTPPKSAALTESQLLKIENITLKQALAEQQAKALAEQQNALVKEICAAAQIEVANCSIDVQSKTVSESPRPMVPVVTKK